MITKISLFRIKKLFLGVLIITTCLLLINCSSVKQSVVKKEIVQKKRIEFEFIPNSFQLATTGHGFVDVYPDKLKIQITKGEIRINPIHKNRFKTSSAYAIQIAISRYFPGDKSFNILATGEKVIIDKIFESQEDFYAFSNLKFTIPNIKKEDLKNSRITLTIYMDNTSNSSTNYAHSIDENTISTLFDY
ncbi:hypothetical protein [Flavobacterium seoulense]|uniref:Lipoprotein n=1 Tax=Flavobacterium seoulense TaxID=1492738 RepID=A0A066WJ90_9FLAO|nr:hypothetical protein [Flavobacterium seoulense]KDN53866.1 hypothetical protein FEM21_30320 [Flavobacterium seoulense]